MNIFELNPLNPTDGMGYASTESLLVLQPKRIFFTPRVFEEGVSNHAA